MYDLSGLLKAGLCTRCIGRVFATLDTGLTNLDRGRMILFSLQAATGQRVEENSDAGCPLCHGIFSDFDRYYRIVESEIIQIEYKTFLMGSRFPTETLEMEKVIQDQYGSAGESIKKEFNREFGKYCSSLTGKDVDFEAPDISITVDTRYDSVEIRVKSLYIRGTYTKLRRDLPQTRWIYGSDLNESVESIIGEPLREMTGCGNYFLHAAGREDVDVRMLGNGREFVVEAHSPLKRSISLDKLLKAINDQNKGVIVSDLSYADVSAVKTVKSESNYKTYRAVIEGDELLDPTKLEDVKKYLSGRVIYQRTPLRVMKRRADLVRQRKIECLKLLDVSGNCAVMEITAESGTYIKELVNGDKGRTDPSISSVYGADLKVSELDVIQIHRSEK
ncbi:MAG: tRNA pseudouridine(54/55) synthase Pus10 [Thermoplasmataceae archaeon]